MTVRPLAPTRRPDVTRQPAFAGSEPSEVTPRLRQAQVPVGAAEHDVRVGVVLPVVLPKAHLACLEVPACVEGDVAAARAGVRPTRDTEQDREVLELHAGDPATTRTSEATPLVTAATLRGLPRPDPEPQGDR